MTTIQFMSPQNGVVWYTTTVSTSAPTTKSMADVGSALVKFLKGLTVTLLGTGEGGDYNVVMSGKIRDNNAEYTFDNHVIYMSTGAPLNSPLFEIIND